MATTRNDNITLWDYAAYAAIPNDDRRHEIIRGVHDAPPTPNLYH